MEHAVEIKDEWRTSLPDAVIQQAEDAKKLMEGLKVHNPDVKDPDDLDMTVVNLDDGPVTTKPDETSVKDHDEDTFEAKYKVLKGKFDSMARESNTKVSGLETQLSTLRETVDNLNRIIAMPPAKEEEEEGDEPRAELTDDRFDGYGPEMIDLLNEVKDLRGTVQSQADIIESFQGTSTKVDRIEQESAIARDQAFRGDISTHCKHWGAINQLQNDAGDFTFPLWLGDGGLANFQQAYSQGDAKKVAKYFNDFIRHTEWKPEGATDTGEYNLEDLVVPDTGRSVTTTGPKQAKTITDAQFKAFTDKAVHGEITQEEFRAISAQYYKQKTGGR